MWEDVNCSSPETAPDVPGLHVPTPAVTLGTSLLTVAALVWGHVALAGEGVGRGLPRRADMALIQALGNWESQPPPAL